MCDIVINVNMLRCISVVSFLHKLVRITLFL